MLKLGMFWSRCIALAGLFAVVAMMLMVVSPMTAIRNALSGRGPQNWLPGALLLLFIGASCVGVMVLILALAGLGAL